MAKEYEVVIGLEIHAELSTKTKAFCGCKNEFGAEANVLCCPICMGLPGALPVLNEKVVEYAVKMGTALHCDINKVTKFDRKNYFYPDLPKAYQVSQFDVPICEKGYVDILLNGETKRITVDRMHIEEDAGKLLHDDAFEGALLDGNRSSVPLVEIVSAPDMRSAEEAKTYMESVHTILRYLDISDAKMQEGSLRADVNVSVRPIGQKEYGTRIEMKNVNSFNAVYRAIQYESNRQIETLEEGGMLYQETRRWDDVRGESIALRSKEDAQDYRYFPDPDLLTYVVPQELIDSVKAESPELPIEKTMRYIEEFGLSQIDAETLSTNRTRAEFFDDAVALKKATPKGISNWMLGDISRILNEKNIEIDETKLTVENLVIMVEQIEKGVISNNAGKTIIEIIMEKDVNPEEIIKENNLAQISDMTFLQGVVDDVLKSNEKAVADYKDGKTNVVGFLVGQCMKQSKGQGNPQILQEMIVKAIEQ
jgi:aspartyl/glutamyl-tRNA(Asn/Gln) amidotransferase, B subunit